MFANTGSTSTHNFARKDPTLLPTLPLQQCELNPDTWLEWGLRMWWWYRKPHSITTSTNTSSYYACWHQSAGLEISAPSPFFINLPNPASTCAPRNWRPVFPMIFTFSVSQVFLEPYFSYNIFTNKIVVTCLRISTLICLQRSWSHWFFGVEELSPKVPRELLRGTPWRRGLACQSLQFHTHANQGINCCW
jgi:hypothetical protein